MELMGVMALSLTSAFAAAALKKYAPETAMLLAVSSGIVVLLMLLMKLSPLIGEWQSLLDAAGMNAAFGEVLLKTIGICFLCQFTADACRDAGQSSLASKVELASRITIVITAFPLIENILQIIAGLMKNG